MISYFFPAPVTSIPSEQHVLPELTYTFNSGTNALRILLRSFNLPKTTKVAIPAFVCSAVKYAVESEDLLPVTFDLKDKPTFWTDYNTDIIIQENIKVIILVHLYGFIHPDTQDLVKFCDQHSIHLIHDAAQSFGIDDACLSGDPIIYSFGPGKSTTAAGGAFIKIVKPDSAFIMEKPNKFSSSTISSKLFLKSRMYGYRLAWTDKILRKLTHKFSNKDSIFSMNEFQLQMASHVISNLDKIDVVREKHYKIITNKIADNRSLQIIPQNGSKGLYFKLILFVSNDVHKFKQFLFKNNVPFFCLADHIDQHPLLVNFNRDSKKIIELSCESSIPEIEINRIANLLETYNS